MLAFLHWWLEQLAGLVPERIRRALSHPHDALEIDVGDETVSAVHRRGPRSVALGRFSADEEGFAALAEAVARVRHRPRSIVLRPPAAWPLHKRLTLPLAARTELRRILAYEMERETPFALDEIWWHHTVQGVNRAAKTLDVDIAVLPRALIAPALDRLRKVGLAASSIDLGDPAQPGPAQSERIIALNDAGERNSLLGRPSLRLAAGLAAVALLAVALAFARQYQNLAAAETELTRLKESAGEAAALRRKIDSTADAGRTIAAARDDAGSALAALAAATRLLPDDAYLTDFTYHSRRITMAGLSPAAAGLIGILANTPPFREPALAAPVVRNEATGLESFAIKTAFGEAKAP